MEKSQMLMIRFQAISMKLNLITARQGAANLFANHTILTILNKMLSNTDPGSEEVIDQVLKRLSAVNDTSKARLDGIYNDIDELNKMLDGFDDDSFDASLFKFSDN